MTEFTNSLINGTLVTVLCGDQDEEYTGRVVAIRRTGEATFTLTMDNGETTEVTI